MFEVWFHSSWRVRLVCKSFTHVLSPILQLQNEDYTLVYHDWTLMVQESLFSFLFLRKNIDQRGKHICKIETILWSCICFLLCLGSWHTWENSWFHLWYDLGLEHAEDICSRPNRFNRYCSTNDTVEILIVDGVAAAIVAVVVYKGNKRKNLKAKTIHEARGTAWLNWNVLLGTRRRRNITSSSLAVYDSLLRFVN